MPAKDTIASVLSFEKKLVPSDGYLSSMIWGDEENAAALRLKEKSVRGTISNRLKKAIQDDPAKLNAEVEKPNLQRVDACSLKPEHDTLKLNFTLKVLGGIEHPSACNNAKYKQSYQAAVLAYKETYGFEELAKRYAINIANARYLWRNRVGAEDILVEVTVLNNDSNQSWQFNALEYSTRDFSDTDDSIDELAACISQTLKSEADFLMLGISCYAKVGIAQDVYPSEELVFDKGRGDKSKILYEVDNQAALHSQKIGNALRTIDTWYEEYSNPEASVGPIAIEPYGAVTNLGKAFRTPKAKQDFYSYFDKWSRGEIELTEDQQHYVMAVLVRGGVFGESDK